VFNDSYTLCSRFQAGLNGKGRVVEFFHQGGFSHFARAHDEEFALEERDFRFLEFVEIGNDCFMAFLYDFNGRSFQGIAI